MRTLAVVIALCVLGPLAYAAPPAWLGSAFADVYHAFGPLSGLHDAYAEYLFVGTPVRTPDGIGMSCDHLRIELAGLHLIWVQTASSVPMPATMIRLRDAADRFCLDHGMWLGRREAEADGDSAALQSASAVGLFREIFELRDLLEDVFTQTFDRLPSDVDRWTFSVAFATRTLLAQPTIRRLEDDLRLVFTGGPDREAPLLPLPPEIEEAMDGLMAWTDQDLDLAAERAARRWATVIPAYFLAWDGAGDGADRGPSRGWEGGAAAASAFPG